MYDILRCYFATATRKNKLFYNMKSYNDLCWSHGVNTELALQIKMAYLTLGYDYSWLTYCQCCVLGIDNNYTVVWLQADLARNRVFAVKNGNNFSFFVTA